MVRPKKHLGQHFLHDENIAAKIAGSLTYKGYESFLEVGPGTGVLTKYLLKDNTPSSYYAEIDRESVAYLNENYPEIKDRILECDILKVDLSKYFDKPYAIIGNFPYNISSQIFFKVLENRNSIVEVVGMIQKEVAERLAEKPGTKVYGILSVFLQAFYDIEYLFTVNENVFTPPPRVKSGVIRLTRNSRQALSCDEKLFFRVVKTGFNQRRKTLRNSLKPLGMPLPEHEIFSQRPEQLSVEQFEMITNLIVENNK